jgi:hypothetical protein
MLSVGCGPGGDVGPVDSLRRTCHVRLARARVVVSLSAFVQLLALAFVPVLASAQAPAVVPKVGVLLFDPAPSGGNPDPVPGGLQRGLREFGDVEGRKVVLSGDMPMGGLTAYRRWLLNSSG